VKGLIAMSDDKSSTSNSAEMKAAAALTTKVLAIGSWTAKATPEARLPIMPSEARDTMRLQLAGKIDEWFAKADGSGAVFLMNVTDPAEAHRLLEKLGLIKGAAINRLQTFPRRITTSADIRSYAAIFTRQPIPVSLLARRAAVR
jgi:hypothetical protein